MTNHGADADGATPLDEDEREGLRFRHIETRSELDRMEQANIVEGLRWLNRQNKPDVLTEAFALGLHQRLFGEVWRWAGRFRGTEKNIGVAPHQIAMQLRALLDNTRYQADHAVLAPLELALRFHHRLVQIHPFPNGNGRHARIMTDALLRFRLEQPAINWQGRDAAAQNPNAADERRAAYIQALRAADARDFAPLLRLFGDGV